MTDEKIDKIVSQIKKHLNHEDDADWVWLDYAAAKALSYARENNDAQSMQSYERLTSKAMDIEDNFFLLHTLVDSLADQAKSVNS